MARPDCCYEILRHAAYGSFVGPLPEALERHLRWLAGWDTDTVAAAAALFVSAYMTGMRTGMIVAGAHGVKLNPQRLPVSDFGASK